MRNLIVGMVGTMLLLTGAGAAAASDRKAAAAMTAGDYAAAERTLIAERRMFPDQPELTLNLAGVYRHTGRGAQAEALYADVLRRPDVALDLADGRTMSSQAIARAALGIRQVAAR